MIYFLYGDNDYAIDQRVAKLKSDFTGKYGAGAVGTININETTVPDLLRQLMSTSLFAVHQMVIVKAITADSEAWAALADNIDFIPDNTDVVMTDVKSISKVRNLAATRTFKKLKSTGAIVDKLELAKSRDIAGWLSGEIERRSLAINGAAQNELIRLTAGDDNQQARLAMELDKLTALNRSITVHDIDQLVEPSLNVNAFTIFEAAITGQTQQAIQLVRQLCNMGEDGNRFLGLLASQELALAASAVGAKVKLSPYQLRQARELWNRLPGSQSDKLERLSTITAKLAQLDVRVKLSSPDEAWLHIEATMADLAK